MPTKLPLDTSSDPAAERDARRRERDERRGPQVERPETRPNARRPRLSVARPARRTVTTAGIVGIAVAIAAIMGSQGAQSWLIGLVVAILSLVLAAVFLSARRS
jgi:hypothetical protein